MKFTLCFFLVLTTTAGFTQSTWKCVYSDSTFMKVADSVMDGLVEKMKNQDTPDEVIELVLAKMKSGSVSITKRRHVIANDDSTIIDIEVSEEGSLRIDAFETEHSILKQGELYLMSPEGSYHSLSNVPRKVFKPSGLQPVFFNYTCKEYISTDTTCTIWVTEELPASINPGIRTGKIKGAVLFFELKHPGVMVIRCGIKKLERVVRDEKRI